MQFRSCYLLRGRRRKWPQLLNSVKRVDKRMLDLRVVVEFVTLLKPLNGFPVFRKVARSLSGPLKRAVVFTERGTRPTHGASERLLNTQLFADGTQSQEFIYLKRHSVFSASTNTKPQSFTNLVYLCKL